MQKQISCSTELMMNFKQADVVSPQKKFEALQTTDGYALLFSIGSDGDFLLTQQTPGTATGWQQANLGNTLISSNSDGVKAKTFAVSQNFVSKKVDIALVTTTDGKDSLFLSLNNSAEAGGISEETISWTEVPFDDPAHPGIDLLIEHVYVAETISEQYIVVDISRTTFARPSNFLQRYYIDHDDPTRKWMNMVTGGDMEPGVISMLGRRKSGGRRAIAVDGIYTLGTIHGYTQLLYVPLFNPFGDGPPAVTRLAVPQGATALGVADVGDDHTDLFVVAGNSLYHFPAAEQNEDAEGMLVQTDALFEGVTKLYACANEDRFVVWGQNRANQIFQTTCLRANVHARHLWTAPIPLLTGVEQVSPYINVKDRSNAFFAVAANKLQQAVQSPQTSIWDFQQVALKAQPHLKARRYSSYTTRIQLTDDGEQPITDEPLMVSAGTTTPVYINNLYYVLTPDPISITTDENGAITVVEEVDSLAGARLYVSDVSYSVQREINPMDKPFQKLAGLNTADKLREARIIDHNENETPLVDSDVQAGDLRAVATANGQLATAYEEVSKQVMRASTPLIYQMTSNTSEVEGVGRTIWAEIGDLFSWLASGVRYVVKIIWDAAKRAWDFIVEIAGQAYRAILDGVEKIVGAIQWLYEAIKTAITEVIRFLEFIFSWRDIARTKEVMKNLLYQFINRQADQVGEMKNSLNHHMRGMQQTINNWAGIDTFDGLDDAARSTPSSESTPTEGQSAPGDMLSSHFRDNVGQTGVNVDMMTAEVDEEEIKELIASLRQNGTVVEDFLMAFEALANELPRLTIEQILKRVIAIVVNAALSGATAVMNVLLDLLQSLAQGAINLLNTELYIPVVSDILEFFGVPRFTILDLFCWMGAIPVTIGYKIAHNRAPFNDDQYTRFLSTASFDRIAVAFGVEEIEPRGEDKEQIHIAGLEVGMSGQGDELIPMPNSTRRVVYTIAHAIGASSLLISTFLTAKEVQSRAYNSRFSTFSTGFSVLSAGSTSLAGFLMPRYPIKDKHVMMVNRITTGVTILGSLIYSGPAQQRFASSATFLRSFSLKDPQAFGAFVNAMLILPGLGCTCWHFYELSKEPEGRWRSAAIIEATSNMTSYTARLFKALAVNKPSPAKEKTLILMIGANVITAGLLIAVSAID